MSKGRVNVTFSTVVLDDWNRLVAYVERWMNVTDAVLYYDSAEVSGDLDGIKRLRQRLGRP